MALCETSWPHAAVAPPCQEPLQQGFRGGAASGMIVHTPEETGQPEQLQASREASEADVEAVLTVTNTNEHQVEWQNRQRVHDGPAPQVAECTCLWFHLQAPNACLFLLLKVSCTMTQCVTQLTT